MFFKFRFLPALVLLFFTTAVTAADIKQGPLVPENKNSISGRILIDGKEPMPGGIAAFFNARSHYPPKFGSVRRIPDHVTSVDQQGKFTAELPAGRYYLGVISRNDEKKTGPPRSDEKGFAAVDEEMNRRVFEITGSAENFGDIKVATPKSAWKFTDYFTIRGTLISKNGQPFEDGAWILIKQNPASRRPHLISEKIAGNNGEFELQLPAGQPYYLIARDELGMGRPQPGRHVGAYTGPDPVLDQNMPEPKPISLSGSTGETVSGIRILMIEVPDTGVQKQPVQGRQ
ncbi:MAG: hypothetical protein SCH71_14925 [Desulfobulbaceae bacterium]|nr:hypothetical protein [Desulfobulbaceae bacterium]